MGNRLSGNVLHHGGHARKNLQRPFAGIHNQISSAVFGAGVECNCLGLWGQAVDGLHRALPLAFGKRVVKHDNRKRRASYRSLQLLQSDGMSNVTGKLEEFLFGLMSEAVKNREIGYH